MRTLQLHPSATYARQYARGYILALFYWRHSIVVQFARVASSGWDLPSEMYIQTSLEPACWG
jgi:hypothetical protein